jgi:hypothetical protein
MRDSKEFIRGKYLINNDRTIDLGLNEILESDVLDYSASDAGACPSLDTCTVLGVGHPDVTV